MGHTDDSKNRGQRLLCIFKRLSEGEFVSKKELSEEFQVSDKTIQRDIRYLEGYLNREYKGENEEAILYDHKKRRYYLQNLNQKWLRREEILSISKVLLDSRAFNKSEMEHLLERLSLQAAPEEYKKIRKLLLNERFHFTPLQHNSPLISFIWKVSGYIREQLVIELHYRRQDGKEVKHKVKPVSLIFSEYYFYLLAYLYDGDQDYPVIFRLDRIPGIQPLQEKFNIIYKHRFEEGEFRKRVQFMYVGELLKIKFEFQGPSIEAILDRLPTAKVIDCAGNKYTIEAEVFGTGVKMWALSQGRNLKIIYPPQLVNEIKEEINAMKECYEELK